MSPRRCQDCGSTAPVGTDVRQCASCTYGVCVWYGADSPAPAVFACPVCNGHKTVSRPPWVAGDQLTWDGTGTQVYPCPACNGTGLVWKEAPHA